MENIIQNLLLVAIPLIVGWFVGRYLTPAAKKFFDKNPEAKAMASLLYNTIDTIIENAKLEHPENKWIEIVDKAIDKLAQKIDIDNSNDITEKEVKKMATERKKFLGLI